MLPQWHVKDPGRSARIAGGRLHLNTLAPLTQRSRIGLTKRHSLGTYQGNEPTRYSSGNTQPHSSKLAEPLWTDHGVKKVELVCAS